VSRATASANVVAAGIAEQQGYPISFNYFFKVRFHVLSSVSLHTRLNPILLLLDQMGFPCMLVSTAVATAYIVVSHVIIPWY
jgi:hypothetical protein